MSEYPKFKYHADGSDKIVNNGAEEEALGKGWFDSPAEAKGKKPAKAAAPATDKETAKRLEELEAELGKLAEENADLQKQLEEAEDHIETLEAALEEASKNDQRGEDGKFVSKDEDAKDVEPEKEGETEDKAEGDAKAEEKEEKTDKGFKSDKKSNSKKK